MDRRAFLGTFTGGVLAAPLVAEGQPTGKPPRIGWLSAGSEPDPFLEAFREGLRKLGYVESQNVVLDTRHAHGDLEALRAGAAELAQSKVAVIVTSLTAVWGARTIKDIPILFAISGDPVEAGFVQSLSRPGGNLTGRCSSASGSPSLLRKHSRRGPSVRRRTSRRWLEAAVRKT